MSCKDVNIRTHGCKNIILLLFLAIKMALLCSNGIFVFLGLLQYKIYKFKNPIVTGPIFSNAKNPFYDVVAQKRP